MTLVAKVALNFTTANKPKAKKARPGYFNSVLTRDLEVVSSIPSCGETIFPAIVHLSLLMHHVRKVVSGFGKKSCVGSGVRKPENINVSLTDMISP